MGRREKEGLTLFAVMVGLYALSSTGFVSLLGYYNYKAYFEGGIYAIMCLWIWRRPRQRAEAKLKLQPYILIWALMIAIVYLLTVFLAGMVTGFGNNVFSTTPSGIWTNFQTLIAIGIMQQWIRHYIVHRVKKKYRILALVLLGIFFVVSDFRLSQLYSYNSLEDFVSFYSSYVLPKIALEALISYFVYLGGFWPAAAIYVITTVPFYILPVVPNLNWLTHLLVKTLVPVFGVMFIHEIYQDRAKLIKDREKPNEGPLGWIITSVASIMMVWFVVGVFPVFPTVVLTGSMEPMVYPGDIVLVEKRMYDEIELDDVMYFKSGEVFIIHRVIDQEGNTFRTKGDNNSTADSDWVQPEDVRGVMVGKVPYVGRLSLWLRGNRIDVDQYVY